MIKNRPSNSGFEGLGIVPKLIASLTARGFKTPTPIQQQAIPIACEGKDVIGIAQTGTGKTIAFGIPMIQQLSRGKGKGLILLPTRELAIQVNEELQALGRNFGLRTAVIIGGESEGKQFSQLAKKPHILVATPGRLVDFLERGKVKLGDVSVLVLDEADRMFDMGFAPQIKKIMLAVPRQRQTMLFSATMPQNIVKLAQEHMGLPVRVEIAPQGTTADRVEQELFIVPRTQKLALLAQIFGEVPGTAIVFTRTKYGAKALARKIQRMDQSAIEIHGNRTLAQRKLAMQGFKSGKFRVLVATDIAARGIDVEDVAMVINFDLPMQAEDYVHRIGRTARAGKAGRAISFATPEQAKDVRAIERIIKRQLPRRKLPQGLAAESGREERERPERPFGGGRAQHQRRPPQGHPQSRPPQSRSPQSRPPQSRSPQSRPPQSRSRPAGGQYGGRGPRRRR
ncbi:MAG: DEAD/DEAH box helicase [bacterium]|nr:DEAD/DEAH box helicase [bacterium]